MPFGNVITIEPTNWYGVDDSDISILVAIIIAHRFAHYIHFIIKMLRNAPIFIEQGDLTR
jgi:hypothetical protein